MIRRRTESNIVHMRLLNTHVFILNKDVIANDLLEKRSRLYSDRCDPLTGCYSLTSFQDLPLFSRPHSVMLDL